MNSTFFSGQGNLVVLALAALLALGAGAGCKRQVHATPGASRQVVVGGELPAHPKRIVSLAPNVTEILFAVGAGDQVVAVTRFDDYPPQVKKLPKVGGVVDFDLEAVMAHKPDLVVGTMSGADPKAAAKLDKAHIPYTFVRMDNLEQTYRGIRKIGEVAGHKDQGDRVAGHMKQQIDAIADEAKTAKKRPRVLLVYGRKPLVAAGPGSFGHELVELAGGQNVLADAKTAYPKLDIEKVIELDPERIIDATMASKGLDTDFWKQYSSITAVREGHVYLVDDPVVLRPAPRLVEGLKLFRKAIRGDVRSK